MQFHHRVIEFSLRRPGAIVLAVLVLLVALGSQIPRIVVDTDPENMLPADQRARVFHNKVKRNFTLYDMIVVGVVNEEDPDGVFNPASLRHVHELTRRIERIDGVIRQDLLSISTVDNISQGGPGVVRFEWLMKTPPETREEARAIREAAERIPTIKGTLLSGDGKAVAIYVPIAEKSESHRVATEIEEVIAEFEGDEQYFITGLPVAEDTFGVEMFKQMGIAAPLAGLIIFLLMWFFFRSLALVLAPMIVAVVTVVATMGLLIGLGFTVHIMSSMIPIFLMPIAVVDSVHVLSEFADMYPGIGDRQRTVRLTLGNLFSPMLYTSLTSAAGFLSLALAPIPPVRVFGVFVAIGIALAFILTVTFVPAYIALLSDERLAKLRRRDAERDEQRPLARTLARLGPRTLSGSKAIVLITLAISVISVFGIKRIQINDNPVRWFRRDHPIRVADRVLNEHFGGTYNAFLVLEASAEAGDDHRLSDGIGSTLDAAAAAGGVDLGAQWSDLHRSVAAAPLGDHLDALIEAVLLKLDEANEDEGELWEEVLTRLEDAQIESKLFQTPGALAFISGLQEELQRSGLVGKSNSIADIVKTVHRELRDGDPQYFTVPGTSGAVAQTLLSYQSSHRPDDLWHFLTPDYRSANLWLQLKSGDNQDMLRVTEHVERYLEANPPPEATSVDWAGLTYLNVVWQNDMVNGMLRALLGGFVTVFIMMLVLFRSVRFAILAMLPLSVTIAFIYGLIGLVGRDYDMPVAVLSALTLGLSIDFAIHFLERARANYRRTSDWRATIQEMFAEPARAIARNAVVIAVGFLPLLTSPLVPYKTVGMFLAAIMGMSCVVTLILLPGVMDLLKKGLFAEPA
jgi:predicted RND superfamily exporter protein